MNQLARNITICTILLLLCINSVQAQQFKWVKGGGSGDDPFTASPYREECYYMCTDPNGNVYSLNVIGNSPISADTFYRTSAYGNYCNLLITSYNCSGQMRWAKLIAADGGQCTPDGIIADSLGHIYVTGHFENLWTHLYIGYDTAIPGPYYQGAGIIQLDTLGHFNWLRYVGDNSIATAGGLRNIIPYTDAANNLHCFTYIKSGVHIAPSVTSVYGTYDLVYDVSGNLLSHVRLDLDSLWNLHGVVIDQSTNKVYAYGEINNTIFGGFLTDTFFAASFDASRALNWMYFCGHGDDDGLTGIVMDQQKHLYFSGGAQNPSMTTTTFSFNGDSVSNTVYPTYNMAVVLAIDTNGTPLWISHIEGNSGVPVFESITKLPSGKIGVAGIGGGHMTNGRDSIISPLIEGQNPFMAIYDSTGDLQTIQYIHGDGFYDGANVITSDKVGNLYIGGYVEDSIWGGPPAIPAYHTVGPPSDFFIMKYGVNCSCTAMPSASFTDTGTHTVGATYTGTSAGLDSLVWNFGDGHTATGTPVLHTYTVAGTFHMCVTAYTNCGHDSDCTTIVVPCIGPPVAAFTDTGHHTIGVTYTGTTTALDSVIWTYGDGSRDTGLTAHHTYSAIGTYTVCAIACNPCGRDTICRYDTVFCISTPVAAYTYSGTHTISCTYTGTTTGVDSIGWRFGDGAHSLGTTAAHSYAAPGIYHLCVIAYSRCGNDTACRYDTVVCVAAPAAAFTDTGHITLGVTYTGTTVALDSIVWNFGDGYSATGTSAIHTYTATGIYHVCVTAYNPCGSNTFCRYDTVSCLTAPVAAFTDTGSHTVGFVYTGTTTGVDSIVWSYGDGHTGTGTANLHTYTLTGTYHVCVTVYTPCGIDSVCNDVHVVVPTSVAVIHSENPIQVFPNPVTDELNITGIQEPTQYRLLNIVGECILQGTLQHAIYILPLQKLVSGVYILELSSEHNGRNLFRLIKE